MTPPWGHLLSMDLARCIPAAIRSRNTIADFSRTLVKRIDMQPYGSPIIKWFGDGPRGGFTLVQLIHTSCISAHFCEESNNAYLDVFSCKDFASRDVEDVVREYFSPEKVYLHRIIRCADTTSAAEVQSRALLPGGDVLGGRPLI
jgi:S-adenosylmethionine/arginine decarboxylase-like enzyme